MVKRKQIAIIYQYNDNWIGGTYYILNIIRALITLDDELKPAIVIIHDQKSSVDVIKDIAYPYIDFIAVDFSFSLPESVINKFSRLLLGFPLLKKKLPTYFENLYPASDVISTDNVKNYYYWIPDFQEHYLPHFFSKREIESRKRTQRNILKENRPIIFSSNSAREDYKMLYPSAKNKTAILKFASILNFDFRKNSPESLLDKYQITKPYFIVCNQFWKHKNHKLVIEAAILLKSRNVSFKIVFTGKEHDHREPEYSKSVRDMVLQNNLVDDILFLGFIDRQDQLQLMDNSISIIQPSLFEGWSTVVEDAKALNKYIIVSDIPLHREQIEENCLFFDPYNGTDLANKMETYLNEVDKEKLIDYDPNIKKFASDFISLFN